MLYYGFNPHQVILRKTICFHYGRWRYFSFYYYFDTTAFLNCIKGVIKYLFIFADGEIHQQVPAAAGGAGHAPWQAGVRHDVLCLDGSGLAFLCKIPDEMCRFTRIPITRLNVSFMLQNFKKDCTPFFDKPLTREKKPKNPLKCKVYN